MNGPLDGLKVIDFSKFLPGPYCTWMLAELGAEVIRIENPRELAKQRKVFGWDKLSEQENAELRAHDILCRNKRSVLLNPGEDKARAALHTLIKSADILVEDYRPGVMENMGYGYAEMQALNPRLIYCSITLCGQTGPYAKKPGHDPVALAVAGALSRIGEDVNKPSFPGVPVADLLSGSNGVIGILAAVIARATTGLGQQVDIAMSDASMALIVNVLSRHTDLSNLPPKGMHRADSGIWQTADGSYLVTTDMEPRYWQLFCEAIDRPDLASRQMDKDNWLQIKTEIAAIMIKKTRPEWLEILEASGTQFAPVLSIEEALQNEHNRERNMVLDVTSPSGKTLKQIGSPIHLSQTPSIKPIAAGPAGFATQAVLSELGYSDNDIKKLLEDTQ